jgi:hypothetical protein
MKMDLYRFDAYEKGRAAREGVIAIVRILLHGAKRSGGGGGGMRLELDIRRLGRCAFRRAYVGPGRDVL